MQSRIAKEQTQFDEIILEFDNFMKNDRSQMGLSVSPHKVDLDKRALTSREDRDYYKNNSVRRYQRLDLLISSDKKDSNKRLF